MLEASAMPTPSRISTSPTNKEKMWGFGVAASRRNAARKRLKRSITKPNPIRARLLRCQARSVRSAANKTRGSGGLDIAVILAEFGRYDFLNRRCAALDQPELSRTHRGHLHRLRRGQGDVV